jgi:hypothetical protein
MLYCCRIVDGEWKLTLTQDASLADPLNIRKLIDRITSGDIRIPAFQRDFVWEADQVAFLLDSIYKGFPIGTVILWRTDARLKVEKDLGSFKLPEPAKDYPVNYVLDGQQRLTSLFSTFRTELVPGNSDWVDIYFDMAAVENIQESLFLALSGGEVDPNRHFPVKTIFDTVEYRKATADLDNDRVKRIDDMQSRFKEYLIPNETFESSDRNRVAIVFERINRAGTQLNVFELLSAWSWSEEFDLVDKFADLQDKISNHGYDDLVEDKDLHLRVCAGVITGETSPSKILDLKGVDIRSRFKEIENGIIGALDFLHRELNVKNFKMLPFPGVLVPLSCFFAALKPDGVNYTSRQKNTISRWFWRSILSRRFSSDVNERQATDIVEMRALQKNEDYPFKFSKAEIKIDFEKGNFSAGNANSKTMILLLTSMGPHSFLSGAKIDPAKVLKKGSAHEFHHIFPEAYLSKIGVDKREIGVMANICFLTRSDNNTIKDKPPSVYLSEIEPNLKATYLKEALCPVDIDSLSFKDLCRKRSELLITRSVELMS